MLKGYRDGKFALGLILGVGIVTLSFLWVFSVNYCPDAPCRYQPSPDQLETYNQRWFPIPWKPDATLNPQPEFSESAPSRYEYYDLQAQENMARATNVIAWATITTVFTSVLGVFLLVSNLKVTREANAIMREEQRPWVACEITGISVDKIQGRNALVQYSLKNLGRLPATGVRVMIYDVDAKKLHFPPHLITQIESEKSVFDGGRTLMPDGEASNFHLIKLVKRDDSDTGVGTICGAVAYRIPGSNVDHFTPFTADMTWQLDSNQEIWICDLHTSNQIEPPPPT